MVEKAGGGKAKRVLGRMLLALLSLVLMGLVYIAAVLLHAPEGEEDSFVVQEEQEPVTPLQATSSADASALARAFGARLPIVAGMAMNGEALNASHDGETARIATLRYSGFVISAVRPASASPLLLRGELSVELRSGLEVQNLPVMLSSRGDSYCAYFADETAAYTVYAAQASREDFLSLLDRIEWASSGS